MSHKIFVNKYVTDYVLENLPWYERDSLLTYIDQLKYKDFKSDPDAYLKKKAEVVNFDMIYARCGRKLQELPDKA